MAAKTLWSSWRRAAQRVFATRSNPFPGARPFTGKEVEQFCGREREIPELTALVGAQRFCLLYAPSGAGKSSLINAGVLKRLNPAVPTDGQVPSGSFDIIGVANVHPGAVRGEEGWPDAAKVPNVYVTAALNSLTKTRRSSHRTLADFLAARPEIRDEFGERVSQLLVLDQFEEIFWPFGRDDWLKCRDDFFRQLGTALDDDPCLHVLVAIREDHLAGIERVAAKTGVPFHGRYRLDKLTPGGAKRAIEGPAEQSGLPFEPELVDKLVRDLASVKIEEFAEPVPDEFIEPAQLQVVCNRLWARANEDPENRRGDGAAIRSIHLEQAGGVAGALQKYYDEAVSSVTTGRDERRLRQFFERRLITKHGTRQLVPVDESKRRRAKVRNDSLERLDVEYGLVRKERRGGTSYWELSHDGFVDPIASSNKEFSARTAKRRGRQSLVVVGVAYAMLFVLFVTQHDRRSASTHRALEQFTLTGPTHRDGSANVAIGRFDAGTGLVIELAKRPRTVARFELRVHNAEIVRPTKRYRDLASYDLSTTARYDVAVTIDPKNETAAFGINVRPNATLVAFPDVLDMRSSAAQSALGKARLFVNTVRSVCNQSGDFQDGAVIRVIDVDRQVVLIDPDNDPVRFVASGTNVVIEASNGARCQPGLRPLPFSAVPQPAASRSLSN